MKNSMILLSVVFTLTACDSGTTTPTAVDQAEVAPTGIVAAPAADLPTPTIAPTATATPMPTVAATPTATPTVVTAMITATSTDHTCSVMSDASIECTGDDSFDQAPVQTTGIPQASLIAVGDSTTCAIGSDHNAYCFGRGIYLGNGTNQVNTISPIKVVSSGNVTALSVSGNHACALVGGIPACWGSSHAGANETAPSDEVGSVPDALTNIATANGITCAIGSFVWCWSDSNPLTKQTPNGYTQINSVNDQICVTNGSATQCYSGLNSTTHQLQ
jgi:hypothetical protein